MINTSVAFRSAQAAAPRAGADEDHTPAERAEVVPLRAPRECDFAAPAGLFVRETRRLRYIAFARSALAVRYAVEKITAHQRSSVVMEVGNARFNGAEIEALYRSEHYPFREGKNAAN